MLKDAILSVSPYLAIPLFLVGLFLIVKGGDMFVDSSTWIAEVSGIPKILVGATIVSFATTLPELLVSLIAAIGKDTSMAIGNAIGSVSANLGLIFAILMIAAPGKTDRKGFLLKAVLMLSSALVLAAFGLYGKLTWVGSVLLIAIYVMFMFFNIKDARKAMLEGKELGEKEDRPKADKKSLTVNIIKFIAGAAMTAVGAILLVDNGQIIAADLLHIPVAIVSAIFVAIGTSLPELVTAITAIAKKQGALSVGNIIGANIIDLSVILPVCSLVGGGSVPFIAQNMYLDMPVCLLISAIILIPTLISQKIRRSQGIIALTVYTAYIVVMCTVFA